MRDQERHPAEPELDTGSLIRAMIGATLLLFGICVAIWVLISIGSAISASEPPGMIKTIATDDGKPLEAVFDGKRLELPNKLMLVPAYFCLCVLLIVAASIAKGAISGGISLLLAGKKRGR